MSRRPRTPDELGLPGEAVVAGPKDSPTTHLRAKLDAQSRALLAYEQGTRSGTDPEDLHQMRVAVRRMRSVLKLSGGPAVEHVRMELKWLGGALGDVRDFDVLIGHLRGVTESFDSDDREAADRLIAIFAAERAKARRRMNRALGSRRYTTLLETIADLSRTAEISGTSDGVPLDPVDALRKPYRKLTKAVAALPEDPPDDELHALRIYGKRLRYAAEMATGAARKKQAERLRSLVKATKRLQDVLGDHQDAVVAAERVRELATVSEELPVGFVAGRIVEHELTRRTEARATWPTAVATIDTLASQILPNAGSHRGGRGRSYPRTRRRRDR
ncbi:MAG TPA: CHAD domain-containing protein [Amycolatopsis sp.]|nr:CHAD domain-containing protein [Amycolatopsis sp.]HKS46030.1 CHAD domain-containing protein [Amycolatopsis sp.]